MLLGASRATQALCAACPLALLLTGASLLGAAAAPTPPTALTLSFANSRKYTTCTKLSFSTEPLSFHCVAVVTRDIIKGYICTPSSPPPSATVSMIFFITSACLKAKHEFKGSCQNVCDTDILKHDHGSFISAETQKNATRYQHQLTRY